MRLLEEMITALLPYPEYADYKESMQAYLDRGKTIVKSSSLQEKMAYFEGFNEGGGQPMLTGSPAKKQELVVQWFLPKTPALGSFRQRHVGQDGHDFAWEIRQVKLKTLNNLSSKLESSDRYKLCHKRDFFI